MKLYVWHNVLADYTEGMVCVMAESEEAARASLKAESIFEINGKGERVQSTWVVDAIAKDIVDNEPLVLEAGEWSFVWGGG